MEVKIEYLGDKKMRAVGEKSSFEFDLTQTSAVEMFAFGMIGCTTSDIAELPKKSNHEVKNLSVSAQIERNETPPKKFNFVHLSYVFDSNADDTLAKRWVQSSIETYCSTINTIRDSSKITYAITHNGVEIVRKAEVTSGFKPSLDFGEIGSCGA